MQAGMGDAAAGSRMHDCADCLATRSGTEYYSNEPDLNHDLRIGATTRVRVVVVLALLAPGCHLLPPPSDATLERTFRENQQDFEQLRQLIAEDSSEGIV